MANPVDSTKPTRIRELHVTARGAGGKGHESNLGSGTYVPSVVVVPTTQSVNAYEVRDSSGNVLFGISATGQAIGGVGPASGLGHMGVAHAKYSFAADGGVSCTPASNAVIPANAILIGATVNVTTAVTAAGAATVGIGTTAGSSSTSLLAATAKATLSLAALLNGVPTLAAPVKMSAAGSISVLIANGPLTAGVIEVFVYYVVAQS